VADNASNLNTQAMTQRLSPGASQPWVSWTRTIQAWPKFGPYTTCPGPLAPIPTWESLSSTAPYQRSRTLREGTVLDPTSMHGLLSPCALMLLGGSTCSSLAAQSRSHPRTTGSTGTARSLPQMRALPGAWVHSWEAAISLCPGSS
jgi:hypothetical protein